MPGDQGQSAAVPEGGGGSELPALPPQVDQAIRKKEELHKALREHREPTPEEASARRRRKELVTEEMLDNEMAILAPLQEGMQALPSEKVNLERFETSTWRGRALTPARHWLRRWAPFSRPWRGGYSAPWSWMTPRTSLRRGTSRRSMSPTSGCSERRRTHAARPGLRGGQAVLDPLGDEEAPGRAPDVWGDLEAARKR